MTVQKAIRDFVEEHEGYELYENYSGRGMFGRTCLGVVVKMGYSYMDFLVKLTQYLDENNVDDVDLMLESAAVDALGMDTIVYFPRMDGI